MLLRIEHKNGFTLVELAIVLVIVGVLAGTFLSTLGSRIDTTRRAEATDEMEIIKQGLYGFAMTQGYLPCPDCRSFACASAGNFPGDGIEDRAGGSCDTTANAGDIIGNLPWVTLGLGYSDPWNKRYSYWVSPEVADDTAPFQLDTAVTSATVNTRVGLLVPVVSNKVVAAIISHGKNGYGTPAVQSAVTVAIPAANVDEEDNRNFDGDRVFISRASTDAGAATAGGEFDDLLVWISEYELKAKMVEAGKLP